MKGFIILSVVILAFIGLTDGAASCYYPCAYIDNPVCCTDGVIMRFLNNCEAEVYKCLHPGTNLTNCGPCGPSK